MIPSTFDVSFRQFKKFFKLKTGIEWDCRLDGVKGGEEAFVYVPPVEGQPRGVVPMGWGKEEERLGEGYDLKAVCAGW
jgi:hypothetical protein